MFFFSLFFCVYVGAEKWGSRETGKDMKGPLDAGFQLAYGASAQLTVPHNASMGCSSTGKI